MAHAIYGKFPYAAINKFIAAELASEGLMPKTVVGVDGNTYSTMTPGGESPGTADSRATALRSEAYILYGVDNDESLDTPYKKCEGLTYAILGPSVQRVSEIMYCIQDMMSRNDWSVNDLNDFDASSPFHFISVTFEEISGFEPVRDEGGRYGAMVGIHYEYVYNNINGVPGSPGQGRRI